jgi:hypothetical protein
MEPEDQYEQYRQRREGLLTIMLTGVGVGGFLLFMILVTGGFFFYVLLGVAGIAALGFVNYLLWGRSMMQATAGEREEEEAKARDELEPWNLPEPRRPRHL